MTALTEGRNTPEALGPMRSTAVAASTKIFAGAMVMVNATGFAVEGRTATGLIGLGRSEETVDNSDGANGDLSVQWKSGSFRYTNSAGADEITAADIGNPCYAVDDQTVAKTDDTGARSPAGLIDFVDAQGVWVLFDPSLTRAATA
ncbi:hypothetical protein [Pseudosulfitobacter pseudonitzschiae]|uniref:hypothetical protein n=1 Tax=Pseudosulfitobacter pseudonitzschiae TaxID=1402135 RepID=UPI001AF29607|nr:hypothetical protein [Pseudosulfitobacter pseudonitzschiae]MBM1816258.1 hypothetical protein [Pseudosulfitobacter pseudonitzschiae]MBM1833757.1 hypothetical protein [Pseudosulfitobacter pseudonitzschiae]MBM1838623.1 hypothetical protein [Pseudosulfitobacter pseudonitzschiae]MBM1842971.1 hypothetical protein [Pseudosulfitobacter pseudonitzschiae]MBM1847837.1 hypothetical protein [Pseudosulfitobacter pseudonitzschiae]